ncbi:MAG: response regulator transcription factor [Terriglobia bacterium]
MDGYRSVVGGACVSMARTLDEISLFAKRETPCHSFGLTRRELEVIGELALGRTNRRIAGDLMISGETVRRHLANIFDKLGVSSRLEVAQFAVHHQAHLAKVLRAGWSSFLDREGWDAREGRAKPAVRSQEAVLPGILFSVQGRNGRRQCESSGPC